ncbi:hypothetical protein EV1_032454 [Malus domestica]
MLAYCLVHISSQSRSSSTIVCHYLLMHDAIPNVRASTCLNTSKIRLLFRFENPAPFSSSWSMQSTTISSSSSIFTSAKLAVAIE